MLFAWEDVFYAPETHTEDVQVAEKRRRPQFPRQQVRQDFAQRVREHEHDLHDRRLEQPAPGEEAAAHREHVAGVLQPQPQLSPLPVQFPGGPQVAVAAKFETLDAPAERVPRDADHTQQPLPAGEAAAGRPTAKRDQVEAAPEHLAEAVCQSTAISEAER